MTIKEKVNQKIVSFLAQYPGIIEFPLKSKEFQEAHSKLFALIEYVLKHSKDLTNEDETFQKHWETWKQRGLAPQQSLIMVKRRMGL